MACEGIRALCESLPRLKEEPENFQARYNALYGAWLCGLCLGSVNMGIHHKLCHTIGGSFNLPHAETHVVVLPHAVAYDAPATPAAMKKLASVLPDANGDAVHGLNVLYQRLGIDCSLKKLGMPEDGISAAAKSAMANPYTSWRSLEEPAIRELIRRAWAGQPAKADF